MNSRKSSKTCIPRVLAVLLLFAATACRFVSRRTTLEYASFEAFVQELESVAAGSPSQVNDFWKPLVARGQVPFIYGEQVAFLYRGRARSVRWVGKWLSVIFP